MKKTLLLSSLVLSAAIVGCKKQEEVKPASAKFLETSLTRDESSTQVSPIINLDKTSDKPVTVKFSYTGTAVKNKDFTAPDSLVIAAGATTGQITININNDVLFEDTEDIKVKIESISGGLVNSESSVFTLTLQDNDIPAALASGNVLGLNLSWDKTSPTTDLDIFLYKEVNSTRNYIDEASSSSKNPERLEVYSSDFTDGTYLVAIEVYDIPSNVTTVESTIAVQTTGNNISRVSDTFTQSQVGQKIGVLRITRSGNNITVTDIVPQVISNSAL